MLINKLIKRFFQAGLVLAVLLLSVSETCGQELLDDNNKPVAPLNTRAKATVFFFIRSDCPISNRYAPEIERLKDKFAARGITFWLVYLDADETITAIREHLKAYAYTLAALRDPKHQLVKLTGARVTPEVAVFIKGNRLVYRGRIDDRFVDLGKMRAAPTTHDLEHVLEAIANGKAIKNRTTTAVGCYISDLR